MWLPPRSPWFCTLCCQKPPQASQKGPAHDLADLRQAVSTFQDRTSGVHRARYCPHSDAQRWKEGFLELRSHLQFNRASWHHMSDRQLLLVHYDTVHYQLEDFLLDFIFWVLQSMVHAGTELREPLDQPEFFCSFQVLLLDFLEAFTKDLAMVFRSLAPCL